MATMNADRVGNNNGKQHGRGAGHAVAAEELPRVLVDDPVTQTVTAAVGVPMPAAAPVVKKSRVKQVVGVLFALAAGAAAVYYGAEYYVHSLHFASTDDAFIDADIVQVSSRVPGHVDRVAVGDNQYVHEGDLLAELDPRDYQAAVDQATASVKTTTAGAEVAHGKVIQGIAAVANAEAQVAQAEADVTAKGADALRSRQDLERVKNLVSSGVVNQEELQHAQADVASNDAKEAAAEKSVLAAKAAVTEAQAGVEASKSLEEAARAMIAQGQAALDKAQLQLSYCKIYATEDGYVTRRSVEAGNFVNVGQPLLALVPKTTWVTANFKETQLADLKPGQPVTITVDAYPGLTLTGKVESVQAGSGARFSLLPPENATGNYIKVVQRVPVKIDFDPGQVEVLLAPGMSVVPEVKIR